MRVWVVVDFPLISRVPCNHKSPLWKPHWLVLHYQHLQMWSNALKKIKKLKSDGLPEDMGKDAEEDIQKITNSFITKIDSLLNEKEKDIMTV